MLNLLNPAKEYSGSSSYKYVEKLIDGGKRVLIVSPYIDEYYARYLISRGMSRRIYVIASSVSENVEKMLSGGRRWLNPVYAFLTVAILVTLLLYFDVQYLYVLLLAVIAIALTGAIATLMHEKRSNIRFKRPSSFVHAKLYISEKMAIEGSANLTYKGLHSNVEYIKIVYERREIDELEKRFWSMWNSL